MTQFFWEVDHYRRLVEELGELGCDTPILPGVMPFVNVAGARRMSAMNNTHIPDSLQERMDEVADDPEATRKLGVTVATELVAELLEDDVCGIHLYALNRANSIMEIYDNLGINPVAPGRSPHVASVTARGVVLSIDEQPLTANGCRW